ncbi:hypothetical protein [Streptomyces sp. NPDC051546]|uniref:hypothetical protein n=1 Tax=Streptomyces sp. NPDC051546 TaxID=3365655 RepID=UPI0037B09E7A
MRILRSTLPLAAATAALACAAPAWAAGSVLIPGGLVSYQATVPEIAVGKTNPVTLTLVSRTATNAGIAVIYVKAPLGGAIPEIARRSLLVDGVALPEDDCLITSGGQEMTCTGVGGATIVDVPASQRVDLTFPVAVVDAGPGDDLAFDYKLTYRNPEVEEENGQFHVAVSPQGPKGDPGAQGPVGKDGAQGPAGRDGAPGARGPAGRDGAAGMQGPAGRDGAPGVQGPAGRQGPAGKDGAPGRQGPAGKSVYGVTAKADPTYVFTAPDGKKIVRPVKRDTSIGVVCASQGAFKLSDGTGWVLARTVAADTATIPQCS